MRLVVVVALPLVALAFAPSFPSPGVATTTTTTRLYVKRPQLKAAKKANRRRPKKKRPSDIHRKPPSFDPEPHLYEGRPPEYEVVAEGPADFDKNAHVAAVLKRLEEAEPYDNTDPELEAKIIASVKYPDPAQAAAAMQRTGPLIPDVEEADPENMGEPIHVIQG